MKRGHGLWNQEKEIYGRPWRRLPPGSFSRLETVGQANAAMETLPLFTCAESSDFANETAVLLKRNWKCACSNAEIPATGRKLIEKTARMPEGTERFLLGKFGRPAFSIDRLFFTK